MLKKLPSLTQSEISSHSEGSFSRTHRLFSHLEEEQLGKHHANTQEFVVFFTGQTLTHVPTGKLA